MTFGRCGHRIINTHITCWQLTQVEPDEHIGWPVLLADIDLTEMYQCWPIRKLLGLKNTVQKSMPELINNYSILSVVNCFSPQVTFQTVWGITAKKKKKNACVLFNKSISEFFFNPSWDWGKKWQIARMMVMIHNTCSHICTNVCEW